MKKPKLFWAFLFLTIFPQFSRADFYSEQVAPVGERALDPTSRRILATGLGSVFLGQSLDSNVRDQYRDHQTMSEETADVGDRFDQYAIAPLIVLGQLYWDHDNGVSHARSLLYTAGVTQVLKFSIQRRRPDGSNLRSMPSGHTSNAFASATALTYSYGWKAGIIMYPLATFVGMSRMADDVHWFSDTVAGAFIGIWMGRATAYKAERFHEDVFHYQILPVLQSRYQGLNFQMEF